MSDFASIAQAVAAAIQALSALAIVGLTVWLARTASGALKTAGKQASAAEAATSVMQRQISQSHEQHLLANVPILRVQQPQPTYLDRPAGVDLLTEVKVHNSTGMPALGVHLVLCGETDQGEIVVAAKGGTAHAPVISPNDEHQFVLASRDMLNLGISGDQIRESREAKRYPPFYTYERAVLIVQASSMLGSKVVEKYRWYTSASWDDPLVWRLVRIEIVPDPDRPDHVIVVEPEARIEGA